MGWVVHTLGGIDLMWTNPATSVYHVEDMGEPPDENENEEYVPLNDGAGARLSSYNIAQAPLIMNIICVGTTKALADAARDALQTQIDAAKNGGDVTWEYQEDASQPGPYIWKIIGGKVRPRWHIGTGAQIFGLNGRETSAAQVTLALSRG